MCEAEADRYFLTEASRQAPCLCSRRTYTMRNLSKSKTIERENEEKQYRRMTETPVSKLILQLAVPTIISMLITNIYNTGDTYFVSRIGT